MSTKIGFDDMVSNPKRAKWAIAARARQMAEAGEGWENIYVHLRPYGMTEEYARGVVFGFSRRKARKAA
jgi:hypothetical protein